MSEPKTKKPTKKSGSPADSAESTLPEEITPTVLGSEDWAFLQKVSTFLFHIQTYAGRAKLHGYTDEEHELGKSLHAKASGRDRPLSHWIAEEKHAGQPVQFTAEQMRLLQEIDAFENTWFPRIRGILQRAIPEESLAAFVGAFFKDLSQQPLGPGVLDSVSALLDRFESLAKSQEPGAKEAFALGTRRGLTKGKIAQVRLLIEMARKGMPDALPKATISAAELAKAKEEQLAAVRMLRRWYNDWAATFRTVFGPRVLIRLGLATMKRSQKDAGGNEEEDEGSEEAEAEEGGEQ
jgi:hypothetical protein